MNYETVVLAKWTRLLISRGQGSRHLKDAKKQTSAPPISQASLMGLLLQCTPAITISAVFLLVPADFLSLPCIPLRI